MIFKYNYINVMPEVNGYYIVLLIEGTEGKFVFRYL